MKQRFSSLDVSVIAYELNQSLVPLRLANVYDLSSKILLFKFAKPNDKKQLVIDTGFRCHLTKFARTTAAAPSAFVARLRKVLKTRRLTSVTQVGTDRILEFRFSDGQYKLFLEFFASGNIILTDADLKILSLSRNVSEGEGQEPQRVGLQYSLDNRQNFHGVPPLTRERVADALKLAIEKPAASTAFAKRKSKPGGDLRKALAASVTELPPVLVDHVLQSNGFDATVKPGDVLNHDALLDELVQLLAQAKVLVEKITGSETCTGYIFAKRRGDEDLRAGGSSVIGAPTSREHLLYEDFHPFIPYNLQKDPKLQILEFQGYNQTVDEFFSSLEGQKLEMRLNERETAAKRKLEAASAEQVKRIEGLQEAQTLNMRKAAAIEASVDWVQEAIDAVNGLLAQGMDWVDIGKLIEREKKRNNPVASIIALPLNLAENIITLNLAEEEVEDEQEVDPYETDDSDSENGSENGIAASSSHEMNQPAKLLQVEINLTLSPWSNAREYYEQRRTAVVKEEKTQQQAARALKNTEQKIKEDLRKGLKQEKALLQPIRAQLWFEKFLWFISSDGYLVLGGKDAHQNEMLYKRHLRKGDVYCHADLKGAASVVIKNNPSTPNAPIPPATLAQAGNLSVCASEAWDQKAGMGAWWVHADQVSKSAQDGGFLPTGSFMVRGSKNFLPPAQLLLGLGITFRISEESKKKHVRHRLHDCDAVVGSKVAPVEANVSVADNTGESDDGSDAESDVNHGHKEEEARVHSLLRSDCQKQMANAGDCHVEKVADAMAACQIEKQPATECQDDGAGKGSAQDEFELAIQATEAEEPAETASSTSAAGHAGAQTPPAESGSKKPSLKRGQKGKAKKIATKYRDQDEEDRLAAEAVIGAAAGQKRLEAEAKAKADKQAELEAAKERRRAQHKRQQREVAEHEEMRKVMMDEGGVEVLEPDEAEQAADLDALVGTALAGDEILEAIPVCAPWNALAKFKYKAKMQPGAAKKGKAVREVVEKWRADSGKKGAVDDSARDAEKMWPREVELIKGLKVEEIVNCVPAGRVRVMMSGGKGRAGGKPARGGKGNK